MSNPELNYNEYEYSLKLYIKLFVLSLLSASFFSYIFYRSVNVFYFSIPLCLIYPFLKKKSLIKKRKQEFLSEFKEALLVLSAFVSAGYSIENAIKESISELKLLYGEKALIVREFALIDKKLSLNKSVETAIDELAKRVDLEEVSNFAAIVKVAKRSGGNLIDTFEKSIKIISDKINIKEEIITFISSKIFEQKIMNTFPLIMILYINFSSPDYFRPMYFSLMGRGIMSFALLVYVFSIYLAKRIMDIRV